jgi:transposase
MEHPCFVGIDVSKAHLDVHVRPSGDSFRVGHDDAGFVALIARVRPFTPTVVVLEATGGYEVTVAAAVLVKNSIYLSCLALSHHLLC